MDTKKISVITVVKNGMPYIKTAVESFNLQNYNNKELIIIYSNSEDGTEGYLKTIKQNNIIIQKDSNSNNRYAAINLGIKCLTGNIFGILHSDDIFYNDNVLSVISKNIDQNTDCVYGNIMFSENNNLTKIKRIWKSKKFNKESLKFGWMPPHTSIFIKKNIIDNNLYNEKYTISADYDFILKIFTNNLIKIKFIDEFVTIMRLGGDSTKIRNFFLKLLEDVEISKKFFKNNYICVILKILRKVNQLQFLNKSVKNDYIQKLNRSF